ncbi:MULTISPECIES: hypothetical protein [unclassified Microcoleus]|uniref:hypothetical protein n=1 Tax=unclassified Microcoleus TaxID=2642155 RepID=UPI002FD4205F
MERILDRSFALFVSECRLATGSRSRDGIGLESGIRDSAPCEFFLAPPIEPVTTIRLSNKKNETIELPIDSHNQQVANIYPNSTPAPGKFAVSAIVSIT